MILLRNGCSSRLNALLIGAFRSLRRSPLRSGLATLSLTIGVAAVVAVVGVGNGAKARVEASLAGLDSRQLILSARMRIGKDGWQLAFPENDGLDIGDYHAIQHDIRGIAAISPQLHLASGGSGPVTAQGRGILADVLGIDVQGFTLDSRKLLRGGVFGPLDVSRASNVCVISQSVAEELFSSANPVGLLMQIGQVPFRILGVVEDRVSASDPHRLYLGFAQVFIPYTSFLLRLDRNADAGMRIAMRVESPLLINRVATNVSNLMEKRRGNRTAEFTTYNVADTVEAFSNSSRTLALLLIFISTISLVVGGIGIMNVMLMSVTERVREIGIRMAVGAREGDVLNQFLLEAAVLSVLGGTMGIVVGGGVAQVINRWSEWPFLVTPGTILGAFGLSAAIGILFGYYPARRAARLKPIEALRAD